MAHAHSGGPGITRANMPRNVFGYEIVDVVGHGAGSVIYAACHPETGQLCALKHVVCADDKGHRLVEQLQTEMDVGQKVNHAGLRRSLDLKIHRTWLHQVDEAALAMEFFDGASLDVRQPANLSETLGGFIRAAEALAALHALGYVHCDVKPNNVLLGADGQAKVIDLGQTCPVGAKKERVQGTPDFISPEQVHCQPILPQTDVYGFGATLYWVLCDKKRITTAYTLKKKANSFLFDQGIAPPHELNPAVPENLSNLVMECIRTNLAKRPDSMRELARRLETIEFSLHHVPAPAPETEADQTHVPDIPIA